MRMDTLVCCALNATMKNACIRVCTYGARTRTTDGRQADALSPAIIEFFPSPALTPIYFSVIRNHIISQLHRSYSSFYIGSLANTNMRNIYPCQRGGANIHVRMTLQNSLLKITL